jgi:hypothetical protein
VLWVRHNGLGPKASLITQSNSRQKSDGNDNRPYKDRSAAPCGSSWTAMEANCLGACHPLPPMGKEYDVFLAI